MLYKKGGEEMSKWVNRLDLKDLWKTREEGNLTIQELGKAVADRIRKSKFYKLKIHEEALREIVLDFEGCSEDVEKFDGILEQLYDWADTPLTTPLGQMQRKMCWIETF